MPNWVYNGLTIEGNPEQVTKMMEQLNRPYKYSVKSNGDLAYSIKEQSFSNPVFSFYNIVAPTDLEQYHSTCDVDGMRNPDNWYNWNLRNWGTKWDVAVADGEEYPDTYMEDHVANGENSVVYYNFNTAWGIPNEALIKLSSQYPTLLFTLSYEEETGWGGEHEYLRGERLEGTEYNWKCRECDYMELGEPPYCEECEYDMCPSCGYGEPDEICQTHGVKLESTEKVEA